MVRPCAGVASTEKYHLLQSVKPDFEPQARVYLHGEIWVAMVTNFKTLWGLKSYTLSYLGSFIQNSALIPS